jgi:hypothetical protein
MARTLRYLPLTFLVGKEGFVLFFPFLVVCMAMHLILRAVLVGWRQ